MIRQVLRIGNGTDTGTKGDTGPASNGVLKALHYVPAGGDTGGTITVTIPVVMGDTGGARTVLNAAVLTTIIPVTWTPMQPVNFYTGADNSGDTGYLEIPIAEGEHLRAKGKSGTSTIFGKLYAYIEER